MIWATWIFARQWNASKGEPCLIAAPKYEMASFMSFRSDMLAVNARSKPQVPDVLTIVVLAQVYLRISEVLPSCNRNMGDADLLSFRPSIKPSRHMMPRLS